MLYIRTTAYNASKTLKRAVESVLNQTYRNFEYYLTDNGSVDNGETRRIVEEYARQDCRIKAFYNEKNHVWDDNKEVLWLPHHIEPDDYFCLLDADDEYTSTFFEDMLTFIEENQLDIAACGSDFIRAEDNELIGGRILSRDLILQGDKFALYFPVYHQFMRTIWGKIFKGKTLIRTIIDPTSPKMPQVYGNDTFFTTYAFRDAKRVGVLAKSLHRYYMSPKSNSYLFNPERSKCDRILRKAAMDFLKPYGPVSQKNMDFLNAVHANATKDTLVVILSTKMPVLEKMKWTKELLSDESVMILFDSVSSAVMEVVTQIRKKILNWLSVQKACGTIEGAEISADIICLLFPKYDAFGYISSLRNKRPDFVARLKGTKWIERNLLNQPILKYVSAGLAFALSDIIKCIIAEDYRKAWNLFLLNNRVKIDPKDEEAYYLLGQNLAAVVEDADAYIYFKIEWISYLIKHTRIEEAKAELNEFEDIASGDERFQQLRNRLEDQGIN